MSSCSTIRLAAAISPMRGAASPVTRSTAAAAPGSPGASGPLSGGGSVALPPSAASRLASRSASGERTSTYFSELCSMNCWVLLSAMSLPRPITTRWSAVTAISFIR